MEPIGGKPVRLDDDWKIDLNGRWLGDYGPHGIEVVEIVESVDGRVVATKITGDPNVPAGQVTFEVQLNWRRGEGFVDPDWVPGLLEVVDRNEIVFYWQGAGAVVFHRETE